MDFKINFLYFSQLKELAGCLITSTGKYSKKAYYRALVVHSMLAGSLCVIYSTKALSIEMLGSWLAYAGYEGFMTQRGKDKDNAQKNTVQQESNDQKNTVQRESNDQYNKEHEANTNP